MSRLDEIRRRLDEATPGRWPPVGMVITHAEGWERNAKANADLIAHALEDLRLLLAVADAADALIEHEGDADGYQPPELWSRLGLALAALTEENPCG